jgi:hypothetical protein
LMGLHHGPCSRLQQSTTAGCTKRNPHTWSLPCRAGPLKCYTKFLKVKCKVIPVEDVEAQRVVRGWGSHIFRHLAHIWRQGCQPYAPAAFYPQEDSWYSFLLEAESTPGP